MGQFKLSLFAWCAFFITQGFAHKPSEHARFCALATSLSGGEQADQALQPGGGYKCIQKSVDQALGFVTLHFRHEEKKESLIVFQATKPQSGMHLIKDLAFFYGQSQDVDDFFNAVVTDLVGEGDYERLTLVYDTLFPGQNGWGHLTNRATALSHAVSLSGFMQNVSNVMGFADQKLLPKDLMLQLKPLSQKRISDICQRATDYCLEAQLSYPEDQLVVMGHSLGGVVAQYVVFFLTHSGFDLSGCSFGSPGAGAILEAALGESIDSEGAHFVFYQGNRDVLCKLGIPLGTLVYVDSPDSTPPLAETLIERTEIYNDIHRYAEDLEPLEAHPLKPFRVLTRRVRSLTELPVYMGEQHRSSPVPPAYSPPLVYSPPPDAPPHLGSGASNDDDDHPEERAMDAHQEPLRQYQESLWRRILIAPFRPGWSMRFLGIPSQGSTITVSSNIPVSEVDEINSTLFQEP